MPPTKEIEFRSKNEKQIEAASYWIDDITEEIVYGGAKYGGKSYLGVSMIFGDALIYPGTNYYIARKELNDLRKFTIPSIHEVFGHWGLKIDDYASFNGQDNCYLLKNGSRVYLIACKEEPSDPMFERFGSMQMTRGWIEEAGEVEAVAKLNLALSIGRWNNEKYGLKKKLLMTCNPKKGWLKWDYIDPYINGELPITKRYVQAFATDNKHGNKEYVKSLSEIKDKVTRQRLWEGNWDYDDSERSLFRYQCLTDMFSNTVVKSPERYLIVDIADDGSDKTVFSFWEGLEMYRIEQYERLNTEGIISQIREYAAQDRIPYSQIAVDAIGVGAGVASSSLLDGIIGFKSSYGAMRTDQDPTRLPNVHYLTNAPLITEYKNLRSQSFFVLANLVNNHQIACRITDVRVKERIIEELALYQEEGVGDGKRAVTSTEDVKALLGRSPDLASVFCMRMFFEIRAKLSPVQSEERARIDDSIMRMLSTNETRIKEMDTR